MSWSGYDRLYSGCFSASVPTTESPLVELTIPLLLFLAFHCCFFWFVLFFCEELYLWSPLLLHRCWCPHLCHAKLQNQVVRSLEFVREVRVWSASLMWYCGLREQIWRFVFQLSCQCTPVVDMRLIHFWFLRVFLIPKLYTYFWVFVSNFDFWQCRAVEVL